MTKQEKTAIIEALAEKFNHTEYFYVTDSSTLSVENTNKLRHLCHEKGIEMKVIKNTIVKKALERLSDDGKYDEIIGSLKGPTAIMFTTAANVPAKLIQTFRKTHERPILKAAYIDSGIYIGDHTLAELAKLKSKDELIGEIIGLLQSPIKNVVGSLQSGGQKIMGILETLSERES
jgi:large subunit ribosomal protein L10